MMRRATIALAVLAAGCTGDSPEGPTTAAEAARKWIHPKAATDVYYHFEVETEGLPKHMWKPPPRDIDVTYRDLDTGRLVTERGVDADWARTFRDPKFSRGRIEAVAHAGGYMWCIFEVSFADASGWAVSEFGRRRCRVKRTF